MTTIPEICLQFTSVFQTTRLEMILSMIVGIVIGITACGGWKK